VQEQLYTTAALITSKRSAAATGKFSEISAMTGLKTFVTTLAGHVAAEAARLGEMPLTNRSSGRAKARR
jgi:type II restriction enzyme